MKTTCFLTKSHQFNEFDEAVFCGYGAPLIRLEIVKQVSEAVKKHYSVPVPITIDEETNPCPKHHTRTDRSSGLPVCQPNSSIQT